MSCSRCGGLNATVAEAQGRIRALLRWAENPHTLRGRTAAAELPLAKKELAKARRFLAEHAAAHEIANPRARIGRSGENSNEAAGGNDTRGPWTISD